MLNLQPANDKRTRRIEVRAGVHPCKPGSRGVESKQGAMFYGAGLPSEAIILNTRRKKATLQIGPVGTAPETCRPSRKATHARDQEARAMTAKKTAIFCIFPQRTGFEYAICALKFAGFRAADISILLQADGQLDTVAIAGPQLEGGKDGGSAASANEIGAALGWLSEARAIQTQEDGTFLISGPLIEMRKEPGVQENPGGLAELLLAAGLPQSEMQLFQERIMEGEILMNVICRQASWAEKATSLLGSTGAENICTARKTVSSRKLRIV
jgi:hypothetical protein